MLRDTEWMGLSPATGKLVDELISEQPQSISTEIFGY